MERKFIKSARDGELKTVRLFVERDKVNVDAVDKHGYTALIWASGNGRKETVELLLEKDANVNIANNTGHTALIRASWKGHKEVVKLLLEKGANVNAKNEYGDTALIWASNNGHTEIVQLLLDKNADTSTANNNGKTALDEAKQRGHGEVVSLLKKEPEKRQKEIPNIVRLLGCCAEGNKTFLGFGICKPRIFVVNA